MGTSIKEDPYQIYPSRYLCSVLDEMRKCYRTLNFGIMRSLIEEAQVLANRMEAAIHDKHDIAEAGRKIHDLKIEIRKLQEEKRALLEPSPLVAIADGALFSASGEKSKGMLAEYRFAEEHEIPILSHPVHPIWEELARQSDEADGLSAQGPRE